MVVKGSKAHALLQQLLLLKLMGELIRPCCCCCSTSQVAVVYRADCPCRCCQQQLLCISQLLWLLQLL